METKASRDFPSWEDYEVDSFFLMGSPYLIVGLVFSYLIFVTKVGPWIMSNRNPFNLKYVMMLYNAVQVGYNLWFISLYFLETRLSGHILQESCHPTYPPRDRYLRLFVFKLTWIWFISKLSDLLDTVFFVLRKKQSQVSFLHVYHHAHMVLIVWIYLKYVRGEQGIVIGLINSVVHVVMYSYYFLTALGPNVQRYLWWKRYITWLQLFQFFLLVVFFSSLLIACRVPQIQTVFNFYAIFQGIFFSFLFVKFYVKSYTKPAKKSSAMYENSQATKRAP